MVDVAARIRDRCTDLVENCLYPQAAVKAVLAVLDLHAPRAEREEPSKRERCGPRKLTMLDAYGPGNVPDIPPLCAECSDDMYTFVDLPCPTILAIASALEIEEHFQ